MHGNKLAHRKQMIRTEVSILSRPTKTRKTKTDVLKNDDPRFSPVCYIMKVEREDLLFIYHCYLFTIFIFCYFYLFAISIKHLLSIKGKQQLSPRKSNVNITFCIVAVAP